MTRKVFKGFSETNISYDIAAFVTGRPQRRAPTKKDNMAGDDGRARPCGRAGLLSCLIVPLAMMVDLQKSSFPIDKILDRQESASFRSSTIYITEWLDEAAAAADKALAAASFINNTL